ncbi:uncharacterized protein LOC134265164 [Saccostrea cucullata]|uniref:uncharacterized protein LOC134265164 n=1 Tax=Saccostrea cuccullata TaxID=36930 RepID=UPI002ED498B3
MSSRSLRVPTFTDPPDSERSGVVCVFKALEKEYNKIFRTTIYQFQKWNFFITSNEPLNLFKKQLEDIETEVKLKIVPASCVVVEFTSRTQDEHFELWIEKCYEVLEKCFRDLVLLILSGPQDNIQHLFREIEKSGMVGDDSLSIFEMKGATEIFLLERGEVVFDLIMSMQKHMENIRIWSPETREGILFNVFTIPDLQYRLNRVFKGTEKTMLEYPYVQIYQSGMIIKIMGNENDCATASNYLKANSWMAGIHFEICEYFDGFLFFLDRKNVQECIDRQIATINGTWAVIRPPQSNEMLLVYGNTSHDTNMIINILLESIKVREYGVLNSTDTEDIVNKWKLHAEHLEKSLQGKLCLLTNTKRKVGFVNLTFVYTSDLEEEESLKILFRQVELRVPGKESIQMKAKHFIWLKEYYMEFLQTEAKRTGVTIDFVQEKNEVKIAGLSSALMEIKQLINSVCPKELILLLPFEALPSKVTDFLRECQCCFVYSPFKNSRLWIKGNTGIVVYKGESGTKCLYYDVQVKPVESEGKDTVIEWLNDEKTALLKFPLWREGGTREKNQIEEVLQLLFTEVKKQNKKYVAFDLQNLAIWPMKTCVKSIIDCVPKPPEGLIIWISHPDENAFQTVIDCLKEAEFTKTEGDLKSSKIELKVVKGRIAKLQEKVDVIVNTTSLSLDMTSGAVSASILEAAGDGLKTEIAQIPADLTTGQVIRVNYGDVAETFGYRLNCERIFHGALYKWKDDQEKAMDVLRQFVRNCISLADERKFKTLAFPAIGTGQLKIPSVLVATSVKSIVEEYAASNDHKHVEKILFVIHEKDEENFKVFRTILEHENAAWKTRETPEIPVLYRFSVYGEEQNVVGAMNVLAGMFREHVNEKYKLAMSQKEEKKETNQQKSVQVQPVVRTSKQINLEALLFILL